jgi:DNA-binding response OmpR family regulator
LVVEDDYAERVVLGSYFSRKGWRVRLAATASDGMEWINAGHEPCCMILDLRLPDGCGEWVLQLARERGLRTYVAVCTGISDEARLALVRTLGPDAILTKPVSADDIERAVCPLTDRDERPENTPAS